MQFQNGSYPVLTDIQHLKHNLDHYLAIESIFGISDSKPYSLLGKFGSLFMIDEWQYPDIVFTSPARLQLAMKFSD